jgi:hypothetical protein
MNGLHQRRALACEQKVFLTRIGLHGLGKDPDGRSKQRQTCINPKGLKRRAFGGRLVRVYAASGVGR